MIISRNHAKERADTQMSQEECALKKILHGHPRRSSTGSHMQSMQRKGVMHGSHKQIMERQVLTYSLSTQTVPQTSRHIEAVGRVCNEEESNNP